MNRAQRYVFFAQVGMVLLAMIYIGFKYGPLWALGLGVIATILWLIWLGGIEFNSKPHPEGQMIEHWGGAPEGSENE